SLPTRRATSNAFIGVTPRTTSGGQTNKGPASLSGLKSPRTKRSGAGPGGQRGPRSVWRNASLRCRHGAGARPRQQHEPVLAPLEVSSPEDPHPESETDEDSVKEHVLHDLTELV